MGPKAGITRAAEIAEQAFLEAEATFGQDGRHGGFLLWARGLRSCLRGDPPVLLTTLPFFNLARCRIIAHGHLGSSGPSIRWQHGGAE